MFVVEYSNLACPRFESFSVYVIQKVAFFERTDSACIPCFCPVRGRSYHLVYSRCSIFSDWLLKITDDDMQSVFPIRG